MGASLLRLEVNKEVVVGRQIVWEVKLFGYHRNIQSDLESANEENVQENHSKRTKKKCVLDGRGFDIPRCCKVHVLHTEGGKDQTCKYSEGDDPSVYICSALGVQLSACMSEGHCLE